MPTDNIATFGQAEKEAVAAALRIWFSWLAVVEIDEEVALIDSPVSGADTIDELEQLYAEVGGQIEQRVAVDDQSHFDEADTAVGNR